eukprot:123937-Amphidinium_carterae.2
MEYSRIERCPQIFQNKLQDVTVCPSIDIGCRGHEGAVNGVCLVAGMAITASDDTTVRLWNVLEATCKLAK